MSGWETECFSFWWIFPLAMFLLCVLLMRGKRIPMICGFGRENRDDEIDRYSDC